MSRSIDLRKRAGLELFRKIRQKSVKKHELTTLFWECTLRCNLSCIHCGSDCKKDAQTKDMPVADFIKVIDSITPQVNPNKLLVIFTGGEALMRTDLEICGKALYDRGYPWGVVTNGMLLTRKRFESLLRAGLHALTISIDGFEQNHNRIRRNSKSFANACTALDLLSKENEIIWDVVTCVNPDNLDSLEEFKQFLINKGVKRWRIFTIFPAGRASQADNLQLNNEQFVQVLDFIKHTRKQGQIHLSYGCEGFLGNYETSVRDNFYNCHAGVSVASVLVDGSISACPSIRANFHQGNIYSDSFMDIWNNRFDKFRNKDWAKKEECADCPVFRYCEGNGMHLRDENENLMLCHYKKIINAG